MLFYPFWFGIRFGSPNHWFCRTTEPHRTSGSAELTEPNRTFGLTLMSVNDFYFIENEELVTVTLRNEHKQRLTSGNRHEKCTKIHTRSAKWCAGEFSFFLKGLPDFSSIEEPSQFPMLCTTEYETIQGESGGPLVQKLSSGKWAVVGIVSGVLKDDAKPSKDFVISRFTSTVGYFDWIKSIIDQ